MEITREQYSSSRHNSGPALTLAGPGTGKTTTLVERYIHLIDEGVLPSRILCVTFTNKAAKEMKDRIKKAIPSIQANRLWIGTFHSLSAKILRMNPDLSPLDKNFEIYDEYKQKNILRKIGAAWDEDESELLDLISRWKDNMISYEQALEDSIDDKIMFKAAEYYKKYDDALREEKACDFADLIKYVVDILEKNSSFKDKMNKKFLHLLVDEYQDINKLQFSFLKNMLGSHNNIWSVGDDDQSIFGWRGANVDYTLKFNEYFNKAKLYKLTQNYRSPNVIVEASNGVIEKNSIRMSKTLKSATDIINKDDILYIKGFPDMRREAEWISGQIEKLVNSSNVKLNDISVLFRSVSIIASLQTALERKNINFNMKGAMSFWKQPEVNAFVNTLKLINDPDNFAPAKLLGNSKRGFKLKELAKDIAKYPFHKAIKPAARVLAENPPNNADSERIAQWIDAAEQIEVEASNFKDYKDFFDFIIEKQRTKKEDKNENAVDLCTMHSSKGLEWKYVFIMGAEFQMMPHFRAKNKIEERKLFYVALTRSKKMCFITYADSRFNKSQQPSPYLYDIANKVLEHPSFYWKNIPINPYEDNNKKGVKRKSKKDKYEDIPITSSDTPVSENNGRRRNKTFKRGGGRSLIPPEEQS